MKKRKKNKSSAGFCSSSSSCKRNGKGDSPRNIFSKNFRENFDAINWKAKKK
jgi:hypothetical protein|tara:strand:- start:7573 stop:7728 length:156 start_codon:yes stop_codon:yes gene_type:complete